MSGAAARKDVAYLLLDLLGWVKCRSKAVSVPSCFNSVASRRWPSYHPPVGRKKAHRWPTDNPVGEGVMRAK